MLEATPSLIAVWTDDGRNDLAADVALVPTGGGAFQVRIEAPDAAIRYVAIRWAAPIMPGTRVLGDHWERGYGDLEWRGLVPERVLPWYVLMQDGAGAQTVGLGADTGAASFASWRVDAEGVTLVLDVRCGGVGVRLGRRALIAATVRELASGPLETSFAFAARFCRTLCAAPRLPAQPVYGGNDWYFRYGDITAETVRHDAGLIRDLAPHGDNRPYYVIDAGWFPGRECNGGPYERGNDGFPDMPGLAAWMKSAGVRPGIWIRPLLTSGDVPSGWRLPREHPLGREKEAYLDPSVPEVLERVAEDVGRLAGWGYELITHDFTTYDITGRWGFQMGPEVTAGGWAFADRGRTTAEIIGALYGAIREAAGDAYLIGCNTVGHLGAGLFELQRTGDDTSGRHWERTRKMGVNTLAFRMPQHGAFFACDADCVGLTPAIPWELSQRWLELLALSGTPLFVSADPAAIGANQRIALKAAFGHASRPQPAAVPLDWMETTCPRRWRLGEDTRTYDWIDPAGPAFACPG